MRVLIVDDHVATRNSLVTLCGHRHDVQVIGEECCGTAAMAVVGALHPDIVLLGVELRDMSGFELLRTMTADSRPLGIMASNCADHATKAFEEGAFDYLVMPVAALRFDRAMSRARHRIDSTLSAVRYLVGERQRRLYPLDPKSIDYIEADGNYVTLRAGKLEYLSRDSIKRLAVQLADLGFIRIERSLLVNAAAVSYAEVAGHGTFTLTLGSGVCLHSSAAYRDSLLRVIPLPTLSKRHRSMSP